jgi:hypothetical protein
VSNITQNTAWLGQNISSASAICPSPVGVD